MSKEIQDFIEKLKDWKNNFIIQDYDFTKYNCEVSDIAKWQKEYNANELINFWNKKIKKDYFELKHPIYNDIVTRAVWSCNLNIFFNWVFFIDKDNRYPFFIAQVCSCINFIITQNAIFILNKGWDGLYIGTINLLKNFIIDSNDLELEYKNINFGFTLQNIRPGHFFSHFLNNFINIKNKKNIYMENIFFKPKYMNNLFTKQQDIVYFYPTTLMNTNLNKAYNYVLQESLEDYDILVEKDNLKQEYDLIIWFGLPGERRAWLEQVQGTVNILKHLNKYFKKIKVYIDGMTAYDGERQDFPENKILFNKVVNAVQELFLKEYHKKIVFIFEELQELNNDFIADEKRFIVFKSLAGYDYRTKICYCSDCDIAISDGGTTTLTPFNFCKKPGIIFYGDTSSLTVGYAKSLIQNNFQKLFDQTLLKQVNRKNHLIYDYHIPPEHIYNLTAEVLEKLSAAGKLKIKNLKMHRLDVPLVDLIVKQYELETKFNIKLPIENVALFSELDKKIDSLVLNNTIINNANNTTLSIQNKDQYILNLEQNIQNLNHQILFKTAKFRIQNHLSYKLGQALIANSRSILGYIRMPFVLSYIKDKHRFEKEVYRKKIKENPKLALPPLESYPDYNEALKEKECFTYKLGQALIQADKEWYKGGYIKFYFKDVPRLKREFRKK
ncbi:hypothetical protein [Campylobacter sp. 2018MI34]|uniref:hypothetical protein n=1 Tax=Campylobacter sp. 2018MI34 TaxID=2800582 RepID=UPI001FEFC409|nr:hypothetical protein [Campylobacter sp. 2018MI34]